MRCVTGTVEEIRQFIDDIDACNQDIVIDQSSNMTDNQTIQVNTLIMCDNSVNSYQIIQVALEKINNLKQDDNKNAIYLIDDTYGMFCNIVGEDVVQDKGIITTNVFDLKCETFESDTSNYVFILNPSDQISQNYEEFKDLLMNENYTNNTYILLEPCPEKLPLFLLSDCNMEEIILFNLKSKKMMQDLLKTYVLEEFLPVVDQYIVKDANGNISKYDLSDEQYVEYLI